MLGDLLDIEFDDEDGWVDLCTRSGGGGAGPQYSFRLPEGVSAEELRLALISTPWVSLQSHQLMLRGEASVERLGEVAERMCHYFARPGQPRESLLEIQRLLQPRLPAADSDQNSLLWSCAWLDVVVRDDLADQARNVNDVWSVDSVSLDVERHRQRRIEQLIAGLADQRSLSRMAASERAVDVRNRGRKRG